MGNRWFPYVECSNKKDGKKAAADLALRTLMAEGNHQMSEIPTPVSGQWIFVLFNRIAIFICSLCLLNIKCSLISHGIGHHNHLSRRYTVLTAEYCLLALWFHSSFDSEVTDLHPRHNAVPFIGVWHLF